MRRKNSKPTRTPTGAIFQRVIKKIMIRLKKNIYLAGFMASGKTSVGRLLAQKLGLPFLDTDEKIESDLNLPITKIFKKHGEVFFRKQERLLLQKLRLSEPCVMSLGGGVILDPVNREILKKGDWIFLDPPFALLQKRLHGSQKRPLAQKKQNESAALYRSRWPFYNLAPYHLYCGSDSLDYIVNRIIRVLKI